ncbi:MAG TPA: MBL fold metallo-hydrolase [Chitinophagaceae bacterium]|jgi:L-ascorbate metabolism protein UlaG (beta-lactamase superfamily)
MMIILFILIALIIAFLLFMRQPQFGKAPAGERLGRILQSPNYKDGQFQNLSHTPSLAEGTSYYRVFKDFFFGKSKRAKPADPIPSQKTDLLNLDPALNVLVWFGHSSYFIQLDGKKILVDPVLSGHASPVTFTTRSFPGSDVYTADEIPIIDYLLISHDHYDHLDYDSIRKLKPNIRKVITGLGVGQHLEHWGYDPAIIIEKDWNEEVELDKGFVINTVPARHFSGRAFKRNISLWLSFVLKTPTMKLFIGGDSGYDHHFAAIGRQYGPFDLAILENGQYNEYWKYIHMMPEETVRAAGELGAQKLMPVHWSKFDLSLHAWDEPISRASREARLKGMELLHPMIGQAVSLDNITPSTAWWEGIK